MGNHRSGTTNHEAAQMSTSDGALMTKLSPSSVEDTVANLEAALTARGLKLFAVIDHSGEAAKAGLSLRETRVVIFGSPQAGTPVMEAAPMAALDLPLKVLVWADGRPDQADLYVAVGAGRPVRPVRGARGATGRDRRPHRRRRPLRPQSLAGSEAA
jgi:uncharacterized protein (DUF302 family)